ncbi:glucose 1-dehydrogenase [Paracraurococcus ruber]|uniref:Sugar dehydrogenase n=1 Tax=Paracraurococcus ruber TaxID=77675 RepID=A0ABS1CSX6_9PROT|nr:glucose 1-dehydrogenase [Paracraurococcus ruber]MBK1657459.1 sugar dehydrogenase [Paracraurococcus ruber]TDG32977.1 glucose 1-dehydrogenase [Paracraurococcus ruber]
MPEALLRGQTAIVTGGSSGIGAAVCLGLAAAGAAVAVNYRSDRDAAEALVARIAAAGGRAAALPADVSREEDVAALFRHTEARLGPPDIVVANAGLQRDAAIGEMTLAQWRTVLDSNLTGQWLCAREAVRAFRRRGPRPDLSRALGKILCMSSVHEVIPWAGHVNYAASKGGVAMMMRSLAQELAAERIRVNAIAPGAIRTPINRSAWETAEAEAKLLTLIPYGRVGEPEDIAKAAVWLASDESDYVTGITLTVDGGMTLYPGFQDNG